jgi:hypothetical protein
MQILVAKIYVWGLYVWGSITSVMESGDVWECYQPF